MTYPSMSTFLRRLTCRPRFHAMSPQQGVRPPSRTSRCRKRLRDDPALISISAFRCTHVEFVTAVCREVLRSAPPASVIITNGDDAHRLANDPISALTHSLSGTAQGNTHATPRGVRRRDRRLVERGGNRAPPRPTVTHAVSGSRAGSPSGAALSCSRASSGASGSGARDRRRHTRAGTSLSQRARAASRRRGPEIPRKQR